MKSEKSETRQGVCYGMKELLENITRTQLGDYLPDLLPTVQTALCDADPTVREVRFILVLLKLRKCSHTLMGMWLGVTRMRR